MAESLLLKYKLKLPISSNPLSLVLFPRAQLHFRSYELHIKKSNSSGQSTSCSSRPTSVSAVSSDRAHSISRKPLIVKHKSFEEWDAVTAKFAGAANIPFMLLQLPQIILNYQNLMAGNKSALLAVPWLCMLTGLLGNLSLLSYFIKKRESEAVVIQLVGAISIYVVILQLVMAEAMPLPHFVTTSIVTLSGVVINLMKHFETLDDGVWKSWEEFITIAGLSALPQVMWSTFVPILPNTVLPGCIALFTAVLAVSMARMGKLSKKAGSVSGWTATLLFMWMPVAQMWTNLLNPANVKGLSAVTMLLAMIGNGLLIPRALLTRDLMWFTGSTWACVFYGWGNLVCLYCFNSISWELFLASSLGFLAWIGITFWRDAQVQGHSSSFTSLKHLLFGH
ncbi:maltose excess protein 1-like, chloroplastic isoform X1 [Salvia divinorum]|uniref:Maltose excess protein 1-like, chloroplastic isoform X1 n=1 Tax=Salvia divinorum TaxID=28513 RepID=A0ABD1FPD2_SALDI